MPTLLPTQEQRELDAVVRELFARHATEAAVRATADSDSGLDADLRRHLVDVGAFGLLVPTRLGGGGQDLRTLGVVLEAAGATLAAPSLLTTAALTVRCLTAADATDVANDALRRIAAGDALATVVLPLGDDAEDIRVTAKDEDGWALDGNAGPVLDASAADALLVFARSPDGRVGLFLVDVDADGLDREATETLDLTRKQAAVAFGSTPTQLLVEDAGALLLDVRSVAALSLSAELVGVASRCLAMSVTYAKERHQFGRPIGSFQAIKHRCAEMLIQVEAARAVTAYGLWCADQDPAALPLAAATAKSAASESAAWIATETIHVHGGIGFTWEHPAHLYYRRAMSSLVLFGHPDQHDRALGSALVGRARGSAESEPQWANLVHRW